MEPRESKWGRCGYTEAPHRNKSNKPNYANPTKLAHNTLVTNQRGTTTTV